MSWIKKVLNETDIEPFKVYVVRADELLQIHMGDVEPNEVYCVVTPNVIMREKKMSYEHNGYKNLNKATITNPLTIEELRLFIQHGQAPTKTAIDLLIDRILVENNKHWMRQDCAQYNIDEGRVPITRQDVYDIINNLPIRVEGDNIHVTINHKDGVSVIRNVPPGNRI